MARAGCFHNSCLSCFNCNRTLDISSYVDGRDGGIYCKNCYSEKYGYRGRSQSRGKDVLFPAQSGDVRCPGNLWVSNLLSHFKAEITQW